MKKYCRPVSILALLSALSLSGYLLASLATYGLGFPLDDAWIHQTYARNLAQAGEWAYLPGEPSAGSTSPLWSALLAAGHALGLGPYLPAYLLGWGCLSGLALAGFYALRRLLPGRPGWAWGAGALLALDWRLAWAAGSGMETGLFALVVLLTLGGLVALEANRKGIGDKGGGESANRREFSRMDAKRREKNEKGAGESANRGEFSRMDAKGGIAWSTLNSCRCEERSLRRSNLLMRSNLTAPSALLSGGNLGSHVAARGAPCDEAALLQGRRVLRIVSISASSLRRNLGWLGLGALVGLSIWVRPDGLTLLGPVGLVLLLGKGSWGGKLRIGAFFLGGFAALFAPYLLFNRALAGTWWPNTFYAKQAEYAILSQAPLWERLLRQLSLPLVGAGALLLPGFARIGCASARRRDWAVLAGALWALGYLASYAWRLPVTYQHGRYAMPILPVFFVWGLGGLAGWLDLSARISWRRVLSRAWVGALAAVLLVFWGRGAQAYAWDVAVIESEMVSAARWVEANTPPWALIAAHDIGALGYFSNRSLLDLAGLVSPEVVPFIRDEGALAEYLDARGADYLVTFPGWFPALATQSFAVFKAGGIFSPALGGENMVVYRWGEEKEDRTTETRSTQR